MGLIAGEAANEDLPPTLVTGVSSELGTAIAKAMLDAGYRVIGTTRSRDPESFKQVFAENPMLKLFQVDLMEVEQIAQLANLAREEYGSLRMIVHVAGGAAVQGPFDELSVEDWMDSISSNLLSAVKVVREFAGLLEGPANPSIVFIGSTTAGEPGGWNPHYSASKAALTNFAKYLASYLASRNIRVNMVSPGPLIGKPSHEDNPGYDQSARDFDAIAKIPLGVLGNSVDIAELVVFLGGPMASWISGSNIIVDGGKTRHI